MVRQHEAQRPDDVRGEGEQHLAFLQALSHQPEFVMLEIAQATVDQLGAGAGGVCGEIVFLHQQHRKAAPGGVAGDPGTVDAATDDEKVVYVAHGHKPIGLCEQLWLGPLS